MSENILTGFQEALGIPELAVMALRVEGPCVRIEAAILIVADKFHVVKPLNERINETRRAIQRDAAEEVGESLKGCRWLLLKPSEKLTPEEQKKLDLALKASPELAQGFALKQECLRISETKRVRWATKRLRAWIATVEAFGQRALLAFVQTLRNWWAEVVASFRHRVTNAVAGLRIPQL